MGLSALKLLKAVLKYGRIMFRNWWYTYPPRSLNGDVWEKSASEASSTNKTRNILEKYLLKNDFLAFLRATQSSISRDCKREFKAAIRGTLGSIARLHSVCGEVAQWQACTNGLFLLPRSDRSFRTEVGIPGRAAGV